MARQNQAGGRSVSCRNSAQGPVAGSLAFPFSTAGPVITQEVT